MISGPAPRGMAPGFRRRMSARRTETIDLESIDPLTLLGERDTHLRWIERRYDVETVLRGRCGLTTQSRV